MRLLLGLVLILFSTACEANVISFDFIVHNANEAGLEEKNIATNIAEQDEAGTNEDQEDGVQGIPIDREQIYLAYTPTRDYYRDGVDKGLHEESKIIDNTYYGELKLDKYEVFEDIHGTGRQGIAVFFTQSNGTLYPITVGMTNEDDINLAPVEVFYKVLTLKKNPDELTSEIREDERYMSKFYIGYDYDKEGVGACTSSQILQSGESRQCVNIYSYAGPGPYDVTVLSDSEKNLKNNYLLKVEDQNEHNKKFHHVMELF